MHAKRRIFLKDLAGGLASYGLLGLCPGLLSACESKTKEERENAHAIAGETNDLFFKISLAEWSLHRTLFQKKMSNLEFPAKAKNDFGIDAVEYVNLFFKDKAENQTYLQDLKQRSGDAGVRNLLIMIDGEGDLGQLDDLKRKDAVENHYKWVEAARFLGCHSIQVNVHGEGSAEEVKLAAIDGLGRLCEFGARQGINIIVENHGGYSSNAKWLSEVINKVDNPRCGTLPDFGNFCIKPAKERCLKEYNRYEGVKELMPYAKGVNAKSHDFDMQENEINTNYFKMLSIVKDAGYTGYIGIEYEGEGLSETEGIKATKKLLQKIGKQFL